jgi:protein-S-isoprenylcysteine O-methyltransferase Ste14
MLSEVKKYLKRDWTVIPFVGLTLLGFVAAILDFIYLQKLSLRIFAIPGIILLIVGGLIRMKARLQLKNKAGYDSLIGTSKLKVVKEHRLVKEGFYKHIRHPLYLGEILRNLGFAIIFSSIYGTFIVSLAATFLFFRMDIEEKMLVNIFGEDYKEYKRKTKRLIPHIY